VVPIYEYQCDQCGAVFEALQKFSDQPLAECKFCHGRVERLISNTSFQLKGSGWYLTDYAHKGSAAKPASETKSEGGDKAAPAADAPAAKPKDGAGGATKASSDT
jgi:putative FmdB family regulatory protein